MGRPAFARIGESRHRRLIAWCCIALVLMMAACGGGSDQSTGAAPAADAVSPSGAARLPSSLLFAEPQPVIQRPYLGYAWSSEGAFTGSIVAQVEQKPTFAPTAAFTLQSNGPAVTFGDHQFRYADGFLQITALVDNDAVQGQPLVVDLYPPDVTRVPPLVPLCRDIGTPPCSNSLGSANSFDWPKGAGQSVSVVVVPRADPAMLAYNVLEKFGAGSDFAAFAGGTSGQSFEEARAPLSAYDFPTAKAKVRGCDAAGQCIESAERSLEAALVKSVIELEPRSGQPALQGLGHEALVVKESSMPGSEARLRVYGRVDNDDRWAALAEVTSTLPGFGRRFALSGDGLTLAVEASPCAAVTVVCNDSTVIVYRGSTTITPWAEQARFIGVRAPRLNRDGNRMAAIAIAAQRGGDAILGFLREGVAWRQLPMPAIDYAPLDIALSSHEGFTIAVARQGASSDPCGCRAVVIYDGGNPEAWHEVAVLRSNKRLDAVGSANDDGFGFASGSTRSVSLDADGSIVAVGASLDSSDASDTVGDPANQNAPNSSAIYVFRRQADDTFAQQAFVKPRGAAPHDYFGHSVLLSGSVLFGGARGLAANAPGVNRNHAADQALPSPAPDMNGALAGAAAYAFEQQGTAWVERFTRLAPNAAVADFNASHLLVGSEFNVAGFDTGVSDGAGGVVRRAFVY